MRKIIDYNHQINLDLKKRSSELLRGLGFSNFIYVKLLPNNKRVFLCTNLDWLECYIDCQLYNNRSHETNVIVRNELGTSYALWDSYKRDEVFDYAKNYGMYHGVYVYKKNEIFSLISDKENEFASRSAIANQGLLNHFMFYFRNVFGKQIEEVSNNDNLLIKSDVLCKAEISAEMHSALISQMTLPCKIKIISSDKEFLLSRREAQILTLIGRGSSTASIADLLNISPRTVEKFILKLKQKCNCPHKSNLIEIYLKSDLCGLTFESF